MNDLDKAMRDAVKKENYRLHCLERWYSNRARLEGFGRSTHFEPMTTDEIAIAKEIENNSLGSHWATALRRRIAESEARDRAREVSVVIEIDVDDLLWKTW